ncbi:alpha-2-macroglobulin MG1 domain protein, partial [Leptospira interrogans serovar Bataviae str. HAI135]
DRMILIKPDQKFPSGQKVYLVLEKGLKSKSGVPRTSTRKIEYSVRQTFRAEFNCDRVNAKAGCIPSLPLTLRFNSSVSVEILKKIQLQTYDGKTIPAKVHSENGDYQYGVSFPVPLTPKSKFQIILPSGIKDDAGRTLSNQSSFPLTVFTDDYPPLLKFASKFGILERFPEAVLPVTIRNLEAENPVRLYQVKTSPDTEDKIKEQFDNLKEKGKEILNWAIGKEEKEKSNPPKQFTGKELILGSGEISEILRYLKTIEDLDHNKSIFESFQNKFSTNDIKLQSNHGARRFEVVGIPLKKPGFHVIEMKSDILGNSLLGINQPFYVRTAALVTNLALHFKWGNESSLVWVTKLNDAKPVSNADIQVFNCKNEKIFTGKTGPSGTLMIKGILAKNKIPHCSWKSYENGLFLSASVEDDFTFTHTGWQNGIENWRFNLPSGDYGNENVIFHPILDRTLFRAGETASIKLVSRTKKSFGFEIPSQNEYPVFVKIVHSGSNKEYSISLKWDREGTSSFQFKIPKEANLGAYQILLPSKDRGEFSIGEFRVEEFRVPLMKADIQTSGSNINPSKLGITGNVRYLSGGGAGKLPVLLRTRVTLDRGAYFSDYSDFSFSNGKVNQEKTSEESNIGFTKTQLTLDEKGFFESTIRSIPESDTTQKLETELEYRDPNGEIQSIYRSFPIYPSQYHVGITSEGWAAVQDSVKLKVAVLDLKGTPVEGKK